MKTTLLIFFLRLTAMGSLATARRWGRWLGWISWQTRSRMAQTTQTNLALCYPNLPESERQLLGRDSIYNTCQTITEGGPAWLWSNDRVMDHILTVEGLANLEAAQAAGRGTVVIAPHLGNWEVFGLYLNQCGCGQTSQLYQAPRDPRLDRLIYAARSRAGANMVSTDAKGIISLVKSLKRGEIVGILPDQVPDDASGGEFAPFFGKPVLTMTLVSRLLQRTGARAVLGFAERLEQDGRAGWKIVFEPAPEKIYARHIQESVAALNNSIEQLVSRAPAQYQWEYKRFRRVPPRELRPY